MKNTYSTLLVLFMAILASTGIQASTLVLKTQSSAAIEVILDGRVYTGYGDMRIEDVRPGRLSLKVKTRRANASGNGGFSRTLYQGYLRVPHRSTVIARVTRHRSLATQVLRRPSQMTSCGMTSDWSDPYDNVYGQDHGWGMDECAYEGQTVHGPQAMHPGHHIPPMDEWNFTEFRRTLQEMHFESSKLEAIRNQTELNRFSSAQVRTLMSLFHYDSSRLDLAKMLYPTVTDPQRYHIVAARFTFDSTRQEFYSFIRV